MPDRQVHPLGTVPVPADAVIPAASEWLVKSCYAHFDGSAAAVAWIPLLEIVSDAGTVAYEIPMDASVAAGASVEATWAPFLRGAQAKATASSAIPYARATMLGSSIAAPVGNTEFSAPVTPAHFYTNTPTLFKYVQNTDFSIFGIQVMSVGHYMLHAQFTVNSFGVGAQDLSVALAEGPATYSAYYGVGEVLTATKVYGDQAGNVTLTVITFNQVNLSAGPVPADPIVWFVNNSGANTAHLTGGTYDIFQLDSDATFVS